MITDNPKQEMAISEMGESSGKARRMMYFWRTSCLVSFILKRGPPSPGNCTFPKTLAKSVRHPKRRICHSTRSSPILKLPTSVPRTSRILPYQVLVRSKSHTRFCRQCCKKLMRTSRTAKRLSREAKYRAEWASHRFRRSAQSTKTTPSRAQSKVGEWRTIRTATKRRAITRPPSGSIGTRRSSPMVMTKGPRSCLPPSLRLSWDRVLLLPTMLTPMAWKLGPAKVTRSLRRSEALPRSGVRERLGCLQLLAARTQHQRVTRPPKF